MEDGSVTGNRQVPDWDCNAGGRMQFRAKGTAKNQPVGPRPSHRPCHEANCVVDTKQAAAEHGGREADREHCEGGC